MARRKLIVISIGVLLTACNTVGKTSNNDEAFNAKYIGSWTGTEFLAPTKGGLVDAPQGRLLFFAKKSCRFSGETFEKLMTREDAIPTPKQEAGFLATTAAGLAVDGLASILNAAGEDRIEETPIVTSFNYIQNETPICFELAKNSPKRGQYIMEFGFQHALNGSAVRIIPSYLNYQSSSRSYILNGGKRSVGVKFSFQALGAETPSEFTINLGEYSPGDEAWFNASTTSNENINLPSPWIAVTKNNETSSINLTATVIETTSANAIAKLLGEELTENKQKVKDTVANKIDPDAPTIEELTQDLTTFDKNWGTVFCRPAYDYFTKLESSGDYISSGIAPLQNALDILKTTTTTWPTGRDEIFYKALTLPTEDLNNESGAENYKKRATTFINQLGSYCLPEYLEPAS